MAPVAPNGVTPRLRPSLRSRHVLTRHAARRSAEPHRRAAQRRSALPFPHDQRHRTATRSARAPRSVGRDRGEHGLALQVGAQHRGAAGRARRHPRQARAAAHERDRAAGAARRRRTVRLAGRALVRRADRRDGSRAGAVLRSARLRDHRGAQARARVARVDQPVPRQEPVHADGVVEPREPHQPGDGADATARTCGWIRATRSVRDLTTRVALDIVRRYDIDALHMDDYFYPYRESRNGREIDFPDDATWQRYQARRRARSSATTGGART